MDMAEIWEDIPYTIDLDMVELVELVDYQVDMVDMDYMADTSHTTVTIIAEGSSTTPFTGSTVTMFIRYTDQTTSNN